MREARWVDRFLYAWNDGLFYDPLDVVYEPRSDHFLATLPEETRACFVRSGIWWSYRHNASLPAQGWKIHVSASHRDVHAVAELAIRYLTTQRIDFKIALDLNIYETLNSKAMSRGSAGKLITIYPQDDTEFRQCLADLVQLLDGTTGAYILSDMRYRDSKALYFRYGQLLDTHSIDIMGRRMPYILDPEGRRIPDNRLPAFAKPTWVPWPFEDWAPDAADAVGLLGGRFRVTEAVRFSNSGGVYKAEDTADGDRIVILKEARPATNLNPREGHDAVDLLKHEWEFLTRLADATAFPRPVLLFQEWEHHFIAEEFIDGIDIRAVMFEHNPLMRLNFDASDSREFLRVYLKIFTGLASAVRAAHQREVVLGDLTPTNLLIQPDSFEVKVIDLEACRLVTSGEGDRHLQRTVDVYTAGFSRSRGVGNIATMSDDLYGIAATMAYLIFPIAAMSYLRDDVFTLYRYYIEDLGWPSDIHDLLMGLAEGTTSLDTAIKLVSDETPLLDAVKPPRQQIVEETTLLLPEVQERLAAFVVEAADVERATLFPVDPFAHLTNPLSLGFGASGVLYALDASGMPLPSEWLRWLQNQVGALDAREYPVGLLNGLAGIAWATDALGLAAESADLIAAANGLIDATTDYTFYYGLAGLGMANLQLYTRRTSPQHLQAAELCAERLCALAQQDGEYAYWLNEFAEEGPLTGLGFGQAGGAMFLLRMYQLTQREPYLRTGQKALGWEIAHAVDWDGGSITFRHEGTLEPYVEVGSAGIAQVLLRYGELETAERVLRGLHLNHSVLPGYVFGMTGIIDAMLDAERTLKDGSYRNRALQQFDYLKRIFLFDPSAQSAGWAADTPQLAVPGEGLLRCTCDLATGSAGVLRVVHRLRHGGSTDFLLDQLDS